MRFRTTCKFVAFHYTCEAATLAGTDDVDELFAFENLDQNAVASLDLAFATFFFRARFAANAFDDDRHFAQYANRRNVVLFQMAEGSLA